MSDVKLYLLLPYALLVFKTTTHSRQCHLSNRATRTMHRFELTLNDNFDAPARVPPFLRSKQYDSLATARHHFYLGPAQYRSKDMHIYRHGSQLLLS